MLSKKFNHNRIKGEKPSQKNKDRKRYKVKFRHENSWRGSLLMPEFMEYVASQDRYKGLERHHYFTGGGRLDCFISCVTPKMHSDIHFYLYHSLSTQIPVGSQQLLLHLYHYLQLQ